LLPAATAMATTGTLTPGNSATIAAATRITTTPAIPTITYPFGWLSAPGSIISLT